MLDPSGRRGGGEKGDMVRKMRTRTRKRHQQEHWPQRPTERSDPTQHAKGRTGDCPGPRKETTTRRNNTRLSFAMFYSVLLCFTQFCYVLLSFAMFYSVLLCFTQFCYVLLSFAMFYSVLLCFTQFCYVLLGFAMVYSVLLRFTRFCYVLLSFAMFYSVLLRVTQFHCISNSVLPTPPNSRPGSPAI